MLMNNSQMERQTLKNKNGVSDCGWCGSRPPKLYRYGTVHGCINYTTNWHKGQFCNKSCHDAYHG